MTLLLVTYDLKVPGRDYQRLYETIKTAASIGRTGRIASTAEAQRTQRKTGKETIQHPTPNIQVRELPHPPCQHLEVGC
jgi:hypothetical protein